MAASILSHNHGVALQLAAAGFHVFPCEPGGIDAKKPKPGIFWRSAATSDPARIGQWWARWPDASIGLALGKSGLIVIDADRHGKDDGVEAFGALMAQHGFDPDSAPLVATPNSGNHHFFRQPHGVQLGNGRGALPSGVDVRGVGGYVIAPGTIMADGRTYELFGDLAAAPVLPDWLVTILSGRRTAADAPRLAPAPASAAGSDEVADLLNHINPDCGYNDWLSALMAVHAATGGNGIDLADAWSARGSKYKGRREIEAKWRSFKGQGITIASLAELARLHGADLSAIAIRHGRVSGYDPVEAAHAARVLIENHDGTVHDRDTGEIVEPAATPRALPAVTFPPGLAGRIAQWIVASSRTPQPELAIATALAVISGACGRQIAGPTDAGTALFFLGLAATGAGKDHPIAVIPRLMAAAGMSQHVGPPEFMSMTSVVNLLKRKPVSVCPQDEFGDLMRRIYNKRGSPHERAVTKILRSVWGANFNAFSTPEWAGMPSETIHAPHLTLVGMSTHEQFYSALEGGAVSDGTLNRFTIIEGRRDVADQSPLCDAFTVPADIGRDLRALFLRSGELSAAYRLDASCSPAERGMLLRLPWCADGAEAHWTAFRDECRAIMRSEPERADFVVRSAEMAVRIATIIAAGCNHDSVRKDDVGFGVAMARRSADMMIAGANEWMAENEHQAKARRVLRAIRQRGTIRHSELLMAMKHVCQARELRDMLGLLTESGEIERIMIKPQRGPEAPGYRAL